MSEDPSEELGEGDPELGTLVRRQISMVPVRFPTVTSLDTLQRTVLRSEIRDASRTTSVPVAVTAKDCPRAVVRHVRDGLRPREMVGMRGWCARGFVGMAETMTGRERHCFWGRMGTLETPLHLAAHCPPCGPPPRASTTS